MNVARPTNVRANRVRIDDNRVAGGRPPGTRRRSGFTLVEILLVVILLGVLAAILIAQFTNVTAESKRAALVDQLRAVRAQIALYKMQNGDQVPALAGSDWTPLTTRGTFQGKAVGPYFATAPRNILNEYSDVAVVNTDQTWGDPVAGSGIGFVYNSNNGFIWATSRSGGRVFNEDNLDDPTNNN